MQPYVTLKNLVCWPEIEVALRAGTASVDIAASIQFQHQQLLDCTPATVARYVRIARRVVLGALPPVVSVSVQQQEQLQALLRAMRHQRAGREHLEWLANAIRYRIELSMALEAAGQSSLLMASLPQMAEILRRIAVDLIESDGTRPGEAAHAHLHPSTELNGEMFHDLKKAEMTRVAAVVLELQPWLEAMQQQALASPAPPEGDADASPTSSSPPPGNDCGPHDV